MSGNVSKVEQREAMAEGGTKPTISKPVETEPEAADGKPDTTETKSEAVDAQAEITEIEPEGREPKSETTDTKPDATGNNATPSKYVEQVQKYVTSVRGELVKIDEPGFDEGTLEADFKTHYKHLKGHVKVAEDDDSELTGCLIACLRFKIRQFNGDKWSKKLDNLNGDWCESGNSQLLDLADGYFAQALAFAPTSEVAVADMVQADDFGNQLNLKKQKSVDTPLPLAGWGSEAAKFFYNSRGR